MFIVEKKKKYVEYPTVEALCKDFKVDISMTGVVSFNGVRDTISYNMECYTKEEALKDFCKDRILMFLKREGFRVFRVTLI